MIDSKFKGGGVSHEDVQDDSEAQGLLSSASRGRGSSSGSSAHELDDTVSPSSLSLSQSSAYWRRTRDLFIVALLVAFVVMLLIASRTAIGEESPHVDPDNLAAAVDASENPPPSIKNSTAEETTEGSFWETVLKPFFGGEQYPTDRIVLDKLAKDDICGPLTGEGRFKTTWQGRYLRVIDAIQRGDDPAIRPKYLVFSPMASQGLGDNQKGILWALYAAVMTDRMLLLEWYKDTELSTFWEPNAYDWVLENTLGSRDPAEWQKNHSYVRVQSSMHKDFGPDEDPQSGVIDKNWFDKDNWKNDIVHYTGNSGAFIEALLRWDPNLNYKAGHTFLYNMHPDYVWGCAFDFLFKFSDRLQNAIDDASKQLYGDDRESFIAMGVHARLGDRTWTEQGDLVYSPQGMWRTYAECLSRVEAYFKMDNDPREIKWVIFSDSTEFRAAALGSSTKSVTTEIKPVHIRSSSHNESDADFEHEFGIWVEQALMSQVDMFVMSMSGFSEMAVAQGFFGYDRVFHYDKRVCDCEVKDLPPSKFGTPPLFRDQLERVHPNRQWTVHPKCGRSTRGV